MIRVSKEQSRIIAITALILFITSGILLVKQNSNLGQGMKSNSSIDLHPSQTESQTGFLLNQFHRTETKAGKKMWEVTAENGEYFNETESARLTNSIMIFYQNNGDVVEVASNNAVLHFEQNALQNAELTGAVKMNINKERFITTEKADFNKGDNTVIAPGYAKIEDRKMTMEGENLAVDLTNSVLIYKNKVQTEVKSFEQSISGL